MAEVTLLEPSPTSPTGETRPRLLWRWLGGIGLVIAVGLLAAGWVALGGNRGHETTEPTPPATQPASPPLAASGFTTIRKPTGAPAIKSGIRDEKGREVVIACAVCHTTKPANLDAKLGTPLTAFHQGLIGKHGSLSCVSCHNPAEGYGSLRLADGKLVPYTEVMTLCAQCHGPQFRDYQHGAHGGMNGFWDLNKGGRVRNNCVDCHDAHAPKYPTVAPAPGPNDRFLRGGGHE